MSAVEEDDSEAVERMQQEARGSSSHSHEGSIGTSAGGGGRPARFNHEPPPGELTVEELEALMNNSSRGREAALLGSKC